MPYYRKDTARLEPDKARTWFVNWIGGPTLSAIDNCRSQLGFRVNVRITGQPDTYFSIPAEIRFKGCKVRGYITTDDEGYIFHHCYY